MDFFIVMTIFNLLINYVLKVLLCPIIISNNGERSLRIYASSLIILVLHAVSSSGFDVEFFPRYWAFDFPQYIRQFYNSVLPFVMLLKNPRFKSPIM